MFRYLAKLSTRATIETCYLQKRSAGHSKWQNIRHIKAAKDAERSKMFTVISRQIKVAVAGNDYYF